MPNSSEKQKRLLRMATWASVLTATVLIIVKSIAWFATDSVSILATLMDSCLDAVASILNLIAVHHALQPADKEHRFGHGKIESLSGLGQASLIVVSGIFLLYQASERISQPQPIEQSTIGIVVMLISIIATLALLAIQKHVIKHTGSSAIKADSLHYKTDLFINGSVIVSLYMVHLGWLTADPIFAIAIAGFVLYSAWQIVQESWHTLIDRELPDDERANIKSIVLQHEKAKGLHDLRTRRSGMQQFIQLHLELDGHLSLTQAHHISDEIEASIRQAYPNAEVLIHADPIQQTIQDEQGGATCKPI